MRNRFLALILVIPSLIAVPALADDWTASKLRGTVLVSADDAGNGPWQHLKRGDVVSDARAIRTLGSGNVEFTRGAETIAFGPNSQGEIVDKTGKLYTTVVQQFGAVAIEAEAKQVQHFAVQTPFLVAVVKGTVFTVVTDKHASKVSVSRGLVAVTDIAKHQTTMVPAGQQIVENATGTRVIRVDELQVRGPHNVANAMAAAALARAYDVPVAAVHTGLVGYAPGRHRNELVARVADVDYVDDSKATNPHAAAASLSAYPHVVWIAGGMLKGADVDQLVAAHAHRLRGAVLIGKDRAAIADALARHAPDVPVVDVAATDTGAMQTAVREAATIARPGDTVLLAPSAASWDIFRDYAERGDLFAAAARALPECA